MKTAQLISSKSLLKSGIDPEQVNKLAHKPNAFLQRGKVIYPNDYPAGEGEPGGGWAAYRARPFNRLAFLFIGADK